MSHSQAPFRLRDAAQQAKREMDPLSDHLATLKAYRGWVRARESGGGKAEKEYLRTNFLSRQALTAVDKTVRQLRSNLARKEGYTKT